MTAGRILGDAEWLEALHDFEHTAFRLELQPSYAEPLEDDLYASFVRGQPGDPLAVPELRRWFERIAEHVRQGKRVERVRVHEEPPTDYQRFERWLDRWNRRAGEIMRYMTRQRAHEVGLLPVAGDTDWWLLDSSKLLVMRFDNEGRRVQNEMIIDPAVVIQACRWRDLAVHHSARADTPNAAA